MNQSVAPWMPLQTGDFSSTRLQELKDSEKLVTVTYLDEAGERAEISLQIRGQLDDGGPWVGRTPDDKWVLIHWGRHTGRWDTWSIVIRDERPKQWYE